MSRIQKAFERRFRELLAELGARDRDRGVRWIFAHAESRGQPRTTHALAGENIRLAEKVHRFRERKRLARHSVVPPIVFCDAGLGGLARWLRASGCDARWVQDIADAELVNQALELGATIITTDSFLLDRRPVAQGQVRAIWVPPSLTKLEQLRLVRAELDLPEIDSRCMRCGGELRRVDKESARDRIPPKTYRWIDQYYECSRCAQLFWEGTHWQRVTARLEETF
jgi:uncharacterized protein with PIN domain